MCTYHITCATFVSRASIILALRPPTSEGYSLLQMSQLYHSENCVNPDHLCPETAKNNLKRNSYRDAGDCKVGKIHQGRPCVFEKTSNEAVNILARCKPVVMTFKQRLLQIQQFKATAAKVEPPQALTEAEEIMKLFCNPAT
jgi:hypothetical protein